MPDEPRQYQNEDEQRDSLLRGLNSYKRGVREAYARQVRVLPPERLLHLMQEGTRLYRKRYRLSTCVELLILFAWLPMGLLLFLNGLTISSFGWSLLMVAALAVLWHVCTVPWRMYRVLVDVLEHTEDMRLVGPAISMYVRPDDSVRTRNVLHTTLCRLLPQIRADHANLLTPEQMQDLLSLLTSVRGGNQARADAIILATLKALEQIGNKNAILTVRGLADYRYSPGVREAAKRCLEHLYLNAGQHRERQTLLRASSSNDAAAPDTLLRPASGSSDTASEQLLRPQA